MSRIMIVDDETALIKPLKKMLKSMGYTVVGSAANGEEAVAMAKDLHPDLILMDIKMPGQMDGIAAASKIKAEIGTPIIFLTGYAEESLIDRAKRVMPYGYLLKPFRQEELKITIEMALYITQVETERKKIEDKLKESEMRFDLFMNNLTAAAFIKDEQGRYLYSNPYADTVFGLSSDARLGKTDEEIFPAEFATDYIANDRVVYSTGKPIEVIEKSIHKDGRHHWLTNKFPIQTPNGETFLGGIVFDISDRINAEHKLQKARNELEEIVNERTAELIVANQQLNNEILDRKQAEEGLKESHRKLLTAQHVAKMGFVEWNLKNNELFWSDEVYNLFGYDPQDQKPSMDLMMQLVHPEDRELLEQNLDMAVRGVKKLDLDHRTLLPNGKVIWIYTQAELIRDADGNPETLIGTIVDVTARKHADESLKASEERYRTLVESTDDPIYLIDKDARYLFMNEKYLSRLGLAKDKIIGKTYGEFHSDIDTNNFVKNIVKVLKTGRSLSYEHKSSSDGRYFLRTLSPVKGSDGKIVSITTISKDITDIKQAEKALLVEREQLFSIFDSIDEIIYVTDPKTYEILYVNPALQDAFNQQLLGGKCFSTFQNKNSPCEFCTNEIILKNKGNPYKWEYHNPILDQDFAITDRIIKWPDGRDVRFEIAINITERKKAEEALKASTELLLKEANQRKLLSKRLIDLLEKDRLQTAMELHDHIGQTLTSLKVSLEIAHEKLAPDQTELEDQITTAKKRAVQALKDIKKISVGLRPSTIDTLGLVPSLRELLNTIQQQTDIVIDFFSRRIPKQIEKERELAIYRITQEALTNIAKHAQANRVFVNLTRKDNKLLLSLEDDGIGFDQESKMKISKSKGPLGLIIMRERAIQLGGEFSIESQKGKGTHVLVEIPL